MHKKQSFIGGAAVLAAASVLCKIIGAVYKIPLDRFFLHESGIAIYQGVCSVYNIFLAICVTGIPIALSGLIARADRKEEADLCRSAFVSVTLFCAVSALLLYVFSDYVAKLLSGGELMGAEAVRVMAPSLLLMGVISSSRGYFQGHSEMLPSALSQVAESLIKAGAGILICASLLHKGVEKGAAGAMLGVTAGAFAAAAVLFVFYKRDGLKGGKFSIKKTKEILKLSIPVTLGAFWFTAALFADSLTVNNILAFSGKEASERLRLFGFLSRSNIVYNLPAAIITAITASIVPVVSAGKAAGDGEKISENISRAIKLIFFVAAPCSFGLMLFSPQIFKILFSQADEPFLLVFTGLLVFTLPLFQTTTGILQALGCIWRPIIFGCAAVIVKTVLNFALIPKIGIYGASIATFTAFFVAAIINFLMLGKYTELKNSISPVLKLIICAAVSCGAARLLYSVRISNVMFLVSIAFAAVSYIVLAFCSRAIRKQDIL